MTGFLKIVFFVWAGSMFTSQAAVISVSINYNRIGAVPELLYLVTCVLSTIPFIFCFIARSRGLLWPFEWGVCFLLTCIYYLGICAVLCFPIISFREAEGLGDRMRYLAICLALTLLTLLLTLLGTVTLCSCRTARVWQRQRPGRPAANIQLQSLYRPPTTTSNDQSHLNLPFPYVLCFMFQPPIPPQSFDEEAQEPHSVHTPPPTRPQTNAWPSRNKFNLTIHTDVVTPRAAYPILNPSKTGPSGVGSLKSGRDIEVNCLGGSIKGEADRRFVARSSPKKHVRIGRGRDLA